MGDKGRWAHSPPAAKLRAGEKFQFLFGRHRRSRDLIRQKSYPFAALSRDRAKEGTGSPLS